MTTSKLFRALLAALALTLLVAACGDDDDASDTEDSEDAGAAAEGEGVQVSDVWARSTAPTAETGAVYLTLVSDVDRALVDVSVPADIAESAEIHQTIAADDRSDEDMDDMDDMEDMGDMDDDTSGMDHGDEDDGDEDHGDEDHDSHDDDMSDTDHDEMDHGDGMTMESVESLSLPAGEAVAFTPGGYHIMLLGLDHPLEVGETFTITLRYDDDSTQDVEVEVFDSAP